MEHLLSRSFNTPYQERPCTPSCISLPHKLNLSSRRRPWNPLTHISAYLKSGSKEGYLSAKQIACGVSGQADEKWNAGDDEQMLTLMEGFKDSLPVIRTYKNDLCTLEICGSAPRSSVLTAMAADKSFTAASNLLRGRRLTIRQTVLPGASGVNSTVSTKLFAPSFQVVERAKKLSLPKGLSTGEFLHKFFEAVEMLHLSKFYVEIRAPGTSRNMSALEKEEKIQAVYSFEGSNKGALNQVGKAISLYAVFALKSKASGSTFASLSKILPGKHDWVPSRISPVRFRMLSVEEIENQMKLIARAIECISSKRADRSWWPAPELAVKTARKFLDKATEDWIYEHVPLHKLHVDPEVLDPEGAEDSPLPRQPEEFDLTHAQLVDLAGVFNLYYEDRFTLANKDFQCGATLDFHSVSRSKTAQLLKAMTLGCVILGASIFAWLVSTRLRRPAQLTAGNLVLNTVDVAVVSKSELPLAKKNDELDFPVNEQLPAEEIESLCKLVIARLVKAFTWDVAIISNLEKGAWTDCPIAETSTAKNLTGQQNVSEATKEVAESSCHAKSEMNTGLAAERPLEKERKQKEDGLAENKELPIFQVTVSKDGTVWGFQPLNEAATSCWAAMPFAQDLHGVRQLKPGFWERPLKFRKPPLGVVVLKLHIDPASRFAFVRPFPL